MIINEGEKILGKEWNNNFVNNTNKSIECFKKNKKNSKID